MLLPLTTPPPVPEAEFPEMVLSLRMSVLEL